RALHGAGHPGNCLWHRQGGASFLSAKEGRRRACPRRRIGETGGVGRVNHLCKFVEWASSVRSLPKFSSRGRARLSEARFPLTPTLSLGERDSKGQFLGISRRARYADALSAVLP